MVILLCAGFNAQNHQKEYNGRLNKAMCKSPYLLVNALTKNKNSDLERFEAIFNWVSKNIYYDYKSYSPGYFKRPDLNKLLKAQRGTTYDFTFLMDTLCNMAGLSNVTVYGYAKDHIFDLGDSIYTDNHAWNAIKLDGLWYLYDIMRSKGYMYYRYTKFSQFIYDLKKRFTIKYVPKTIKAKRTRYFKKVICDAYVVQDSLIQPLVVYVPAYRHKHLRKFLSRFRLKIIRSYKEEPNTRFYLSDPAFFAITHFPIDPDWSLSYGRPMRVFECDSAYYHLTENTYNGQPHTGYNCSDCTNDLSLTGMNKETHLINQSRSFNPRNRAVTLFCERNIGGLKLEESTRYDDSLAKVTTLDTAMAYMNHARGSLFQAFQNVEVENYLQVNKNRKKSSVLEDENQLHYAFIRSKIETSFKATRDIRDLENRINVYASKFYFRNRTIKHYKHGKEIDQKTKRVMSTIGYLHKDVDLCTRKADSLNTLIYALRADFDRVMPDLSNALWKNVAKHDSLLIPLEKSIYYRSVELLDNFKKKVIEVRKELTLSERSYSDGLDSSIYKPGDFCYNTANRIFSLIDERNKITYTCYKLKCQLVKFRELAPQQLDAYRAQLLEENANDLCWMKGNNNYLQSVFIGFKLVLSKQKGFVRGLIDEHASEIGRFHVIDRELNRQKRLTKSRLSINRVRINIKSREIKKAKNDYLRMLKKQRRKERLSTLKKNK